MASQDERHRLQIRNEAARLGVAIIEDGKTFHLISDRVNIKTSDLAYVRASELSARPIAGRPADTLGGHNEN